MTYDSTNDLLKCSKMLNDILVRWAMYVVGFCFFCFSLELLAAGQNEIIFGGTYEYSVYQGSQQPLSSERCNFNVTLYNCCWVITFEDTAASTNADVLNIKTVASCDGTNIYLFNLQNQSAIKKSWGNQYESVKDKLPVAMASVYQGDYPPPKESELQNIWLAFASRCVLGNQKGKAKPPFFVDMAVFNNANFYCDYYWGTNDTDQTHRKLVFVDNGTLFGRNPRTGELVKKKAPPPYDQGYITGKGLWLRATNIDGLSVPIDFEFTAFTPKRHGTSPSDLQTAFVYRCTVTNIASVSSETMPQIPVPLPQGKVLMSDRRFENRGHAFINYEVDNGKWPAESSSELARAIASAPKISLEDEALAELGIKPIGSAFLKNPIADQTRSRVAIIRILICLVVALPIVLFGVKVLFDKTVKTKGKNYETAGKK